VVGCPEALGDGLNAATDEGHFKPVVVAHQLRRSLVATEDTDVARLSADENRHRHRVNVVASLAADSQRRRHTNAHDYGTLHKQAATGNISVGRNQCKFHEYKK